MEEEVALARAPACVAITGLDTFLGRRLAERLVDRREPPRVVGIDVRRPHALAERVDFRRVDLTRPAADAALRELLRDERVDTVAHLAFRSAPTPDVAYDYALEVGGTARVMSACAAAGVRGLVVGSSAMVYGARPTNPNFLSESSPLAAHPDAHCVRNRAEAEGTLARFSAQHPDVDVTVLRPCWIVGPTCKDAFVRYVEGALVAVPLGYDPLVQLIHEDDVVRVLERSVLERHPGVFNVVARGVLPFSTLLALGGKHPVPLPSAWLRRFSPRLAQERTGDPPDGFFDYLRYLWVADGEHAWREFGEPTYSTREAWMSFISSRRMRRWARPSASGIVPR